MVDLHKSKEALQNQKASIKDFQKLNTQNYKLILSWLNEWEERSLSRRGHTPDAKVRIAKTLAKYYQISKQLMHWFKDVDISKMKREQMITIRDNIHTLKNPLPLSDKHKRNKRKKLSQNTIHDIYRKVLIGSKGVFYHVSAHQHLLAKEIFQIDQRTDKEVDDISMDDIKKMANSATLPLHKLWLWLLFDLGSRLSETLLLTRGAVTTTETGKGRLNYEVTLKGSTTKSQQSMSSHLIHQEVIDLLRWHLDNLDNDPDTTDRTRLFNFTPAMGEKVIRTLSTRSGVLAKPTKKQPTPHTIRRSNARYLYEKDYGLEEINTRQGRHPQSKELWRYLRIRGILNRKSHERQDRLEQFELRDQVERQQEELRVKGDHIRSLKEQLKQFMKETDAQFGGVEDVKNAVADIKKALRNFIAKKGRGQAGSA
ncbi:MAG: hypothetical protein QF486_06945 [Candidatus Woesearchaeota archaeon]|jgi:hypothetical protein|nr:hypothetical protein [Candidatus Woesearchaeota archaeon]MDP7467867.1 hypothetical protein [Candidatus Woesearchaeota archaeon]